MPSCRERQREHKHMVLDCDPIWRSASLVGSGSDDETKLMTQLYIELGIPRMLVNTYLACHGRW